MTKSEEQMKILKKGDKTIAILSLVGDPLGEPDAMLLRKKITTVINDHVHHVIIDLTGVKHINSAGLGGLISAMCSMLRVGGAVFFANANTHVTDTFRITHLDQVFNTYQSVDDALKNSE
jgi:anti-sigma B factor antagonist